MKEYLDILDKIKTSVMMKKRSKDYAWVSETLKRQIKGKPGVISKLWKREKVLRAYHDKVKHWQQKSTRRLIMEMFWWPTLQWNVREFVRTSHECQLTTKGNVAWNFGTRPVLRLFRTFSLKFTGPLPATETMEK